MRRWLALLVLSLAALLASSPPAHAQGQYVSGSITVADGGTCSTASAFVLMNLSGGSASVAINVSGTFSATLSFVTTVDTAAHYTAVNAYPPNSTTAVTSTTGAGTWTVSVPGMASLCVYASAYASGTAVVAMRSTAAISASTRGGGGGGGSGTVSGQANGVIPLGTTATSITQQSHLDDGVTTASTIHSSENVSVTGSGTFTGGVVVPSDGVHPTNLIGGGNTTLPSLSSNQFGLFYPPAATFTSWSLQFGSAIPTTTDLFSCVVTGTNCLLTDSGVGATGGALTATTFNGVAMTLGPGSVNANNINIGVSAGTSLTTGQYDICIGTSACTSTSTQSQNVIIGGFAGDSLTSASVTGVGYSACQNASGGTASCFGVSSSVGANSNATALGYQAATTANNQISLGNSSVTGLLIGGTTGDTSSGTLCTATFTTKAGIVTACTATSDIRLKTHIQPVFRGLSDVLKLQPIIYTYNDEGQKINGVGPNDQFEGFSAQDVKSVMPEAVGVEPHDGIDYLSLPQGDRPIVAALVNAVKEQQRQIESLRKEVRQLHVQITDGHNILAGNSGSTR